MVFNFFRNFASKFRHHFRFSKEEIEACVISVFIMAFIISFNKWGVGNKFDLFTGLSNLLKYIIIVGIVLGIHIITIKIYALRVGFRAEYKMWWYGLIIGLILCFLFGSFTKGMSKQWTLWFLAPGGVFFHHMPIHRLGYFRYGLNMDTVGWICMWGVLSTLIFGVILKLALYIFPGSELLKGALAVCLVFTFCSMLPFPPLAGSRIFFWSRLTYAFLFGIILGLCILLWLDLNLLWTLLFSLIIGIIVWALDLFNLEGGL